MGFTIEELMSEILQSSLDDQQKVNLLTNIFTRGQLAKEVFLIKNDGEDLFGCCKRRINAQGKMEVVDTDFTAEEAVNDYASSIMNQPIK